ncbi:MAG: hypothetical protein LRS48_03215, partial [Desulfurococcales archaeon]|nr:hypothetical protein [Desulfurococcales archaeon]
LIASLLVALPGSIPSRPPLVRLIAPQLYARERLRYVEALLASTGLDVSIGSESIRLERTSTKSNRLKPLPGVAETLTILSYAAPCEVSKIVINTAALSNDQLQELQYLVKLIGYDAEAYSDRLELSKSSPKAIVYNTEQVPELAIPLIINAFRVGGSAVSGLRPSISEGLVSRHIESVGKTFGAEAYLEEDERLRVLKPLEKGGESTMSCRGLDPASCSLVVYGVLAGRRRAVVDQAEKAINMIPFGLEYLQMLGIDISV